MEKNEIEHLQALRTTLRKQLFQHERKAAKQGIKADPVILIQIEDLKHEIAAIDTRLAAANDTQSRNDQAQPPMDGSIAGLAEIGRKLAAGDLTGMAVLAAKMRSGKEIVWARDSADLLRLLAALADNLIHDPTQDDLNAAFGAMADHEVDEVAAVLLELQQQISTEAARRRGKPIEPMD